MRTAKERQLDMLHSSIWNKLPRFAFPVAATAILEQLFNASDLAIVGNFTGAGAVPGGILVAATPLLIFVALWGWVGFVIGTAGVVLLLVSNRTVNDGHSYLYPLIPFDGNACLSVFFRVMKKDVGSKK